MKANEAANLFREMAARLDRVQAEEFGGCYLVVSPEGRTLDGVSVTKAPAEVAFWSEMIGRVDMVVEEQKRAAQSQGGFGGRGF